MSPTSIDKNIVTLRSRISLWKWKTDKKKKKTPYRNIIRNVSISTYVLHWSNISAKDHDAISLGAVIIVTAQFLTFKEDKEIYNEGPLDVNIKG